MGRNTTHVASGRQPLEAAPLPQPAVLTSEERRLVILSGFRGSNPAKLGESGPHTRHIDCTLAGAYEYNAHERKR